MKFARRDKEKKTLREPITLKKNPHTVKNQKKTKADKTSSLTRADSFHSMYSLNPFFVLVTGIESTNQKAKKKECNIRG